MAKKGNLTEGNILSTLLMFTIPVLFTILLQTAYGTADLLIVGQFASVPDVSGVTIGSQVSVAVTSFFTGLSTGTTVLIGRHIGAKELEKTSKVVGANIALFATLAVVVSLVLALGSHLIATLLQTPAESFAQARAYLFISGAGTVFIVFYNLIGSIFRGLGDSKTPLITVAIACVINVILDLLFIKVFTWGASGAALATVIAQGSSVGLSIMLMRKRTLPFTFSKKDVRYDKEIICNTIKLGTPIALQGLLVCVSFLFVTSIVNTLGVAASASVGIVSKIITLVMIVPQAFMQSLSPFTAQNFGARRIERARTAMRYAIAISTAFGACTAYFSFFHGTIFTRIFTSDPEITANALEYLKAYSFDCLLVGMQFPFCGYLSGYGKTTFVMVQSMIGAFFVRMPLAYFFSQMPNTSMFYIGLAIPSSTFLQLLLYATFYTILLKRDPYKI